MSPPLLSESYVFDPRPYYPLVSTVKRFWDPSWTVDGLTLVFTHGTGFHKEQWEPTIDDLLELIRQQNPNKIKVREIWTIDAPNHGDAAILNEKSLQHGYEAVCEFAAYASCMIILQNSTYSPVAGIRAQYTRLPYWEGPDSVREPQLGLREQSRNG